MKSCSWKHGQKGLTELTVAHRCRVRRLLIGPNVGRQGRCARSLPPSVFPAAFVTAPHLSTLDQRDKRSEVVTSLCLVDCAGTLGNTATCRRREKNRFDGHRKNVGQPTETNHTIPIVILFCECIVWLDIGAAV